MLKRFLLLLTAVCVLLCGGCGHGTEPSESLPTPPSPPVSHTPVGVQTFTLPYSHDDTLNPYAAVTEVNLNLATLLYDRLVLSDPTASPQLSLAESVTSADATHLVVTLRQGAVFSDGSAVTAADVVKSFQQAKKSAHYQTLLTNVADAKGNDKQHQITFTLTTADVNGTACLDFPIVKAATLTDEAGRAPIGGGLYTVSGAQLIANPHAAATPQFETVALRHLPNAATWYHALSNGDIAYYFDDLSEGEAPRVTGASRPVVMNNLVFLGVNGYKGKLSDPAVRQALNLLMDRSEVIRTAYFNYAVATSQPWRTVESVVAAQDVDGAVSLLEAADCKAKNGVRLSLELIYCTDRPDRGRVAELIRQQAQAGGVTMNLVPLTEAEYRLRLKNGEFDLFLGEIRLTADNSLRPFFMGGDVAYGINAGSSAALAYRQYLGGEIAADVFFAAFAADMPFIPVCWRCGVAAFDRRLTAVTPTGADVYFGFAEWE